MDDLFGIIWAAIDLANKGGRLISRKGGDAMEVKDALALMIQFSTLVILILSFHKRK